MAPYPPHKWTLAEIVDAWSGDDVQLVEALIESPGDELAVLHAASWIAIPEAALGNDGPDRYRGEQDKQGDGRQTNAAQERSDG